MFVVFWDTSSSESLIALLIRNGWQKMSAVRQARGGMTLRSGHLSVPSDTVSKEFGLFFVTNGQGWSIGC